jgi:hypothetical protein
VKRRSNRADKALAFFDAVKKSQRGRKHPFLPYVCILHTNHDDKTMRRNAMKRIKKRTPTFRVERNIPRCPPTQRCQPTPATKTNATKSMAAKTALWRSVVCFSALGISTLAACKGKTPPAKTTSSNAASQKKQSATGQDGNSARPNKTKNPPKSNKPTGRTSKGAAEKTARSPAKITIVNDTKKPLVFETTFGPSDPIAVNRLDGPLDHITGLGRCACPCGGPRCPNAARPQTAKISLAAGQTHTFSWAGRLTRSQTDPKTGSCCVVFDPPVGRYVFTACTTDKRCGRQEVALPAKKDITIRMSNQARAASCTALEPTLAARATKHFRSQLSTVLKKRPVAKCPLRPRCITPKKLTAELDAARKKPCSMFVIPHRRQVELRAFLPLPPQKVGGESYSRFSDPDFTRIFRVKYER